jgi:hypothetical protein
MSRKTAEVESGVASAGMAARVWGFLGIIYALALSRVEQGQGKRARGDTFDRELVDAVREGDDGCRRISPKPPLRSP